MAPVEHWLVYGEYARGREELLKRRAVGGGQAMEAEHLHVADRGNRRDVGGDELPQGGVLRLGRVDDDVLSRSIGRVLPARQVPLVRQDPQLRPFVPCAVWNAFAGSSSPCVLNVAPAPPSFTNGCSFGIRSRSALRDPSGKAPKRLVFPAIGGLGGPSVNERSPLLRMQ